MTKYKSSEIVRSRTKAGGLFGSGAEGARDKAQDRRVQRTLKDLREGLLALMVERGYEALTVQDILDRAGVGRATFYEHFRGKDDLLRRSLEPLRDHLREEWKLAAEGANEAGAELGFVLPFLRHVDSHRALYRATVGRESWAIVHGEIKRMLTEFAAEAMAGPDGHCGALGQGLFAQYVSGALMSVVVWWLDSRVKASAEEMNAAFVRMTAAALAMASRRRLMRAD
jgi:AcrR family transcriptional regulator